MPQAKGYANAKKIVFLGLALGDSAVKATKAETTLGKAAAFLSSLDEVADLLTLDLQELELEWADWGEDDKVALMDECKKEFDLADDGLEEKVEEYLGIGLDFLELVHRAVDAHKSQASA